MRKDCRVNESMKMVMSSIEHPGVTGRKIVPETEAFAEGCRWTWRLRLRLTGPTAVPEVAPLYRNGNRLAAYPVLCFSFILSDPLLLVPPPFLVVSVALFLGARNRLFRTNLGDRGLSYVRHGHDTRTRK